MAKQPFRFKPLGSKDFWQVRLDPPKTKQSAFVEQKGMQKKPSAVSRHWFAGPHSEVFVQRFVQ